MSNHDIRAARRLFEQPVRAINEHVRDAGEDFLGGAAKVDVRPVIAAS